MGVTESMGSIGSMWSMWSMGSPSTGVAGSKETKGSGDRDEPGPSSPLGERLPHWLPPHCGWLGKGTQNGFPNRLV
jgi:hypothetical protein